MPGLRCDVNRARMITPAKRFIFRGWILRTSESGQQLGEVSLPCRVFEQTKVDAVV
jgi:hypothetical protein